MIKSGILAIDIGTSSIRASLYVKTEGIKYNFSQKHTLKKEFDVLSLWKEVFQLMKQFLATIQDEIFIEAIGVSSFLGWVVVNKNGNPVRNAWSWMAYGESEELTLIKQKVNFNMNEIIGRELNGQLGVFYWGKTIKQQNEEVVVLSIKDFINYKLTDIFMMDRSHASYSGLYSIVKNYWDSDLFKTYDLPCSIVPKLGNGDETVGQVNQSIQSQIKGMTSDTLVILSGPDGTLAMLGSGGYKKNSNIEVLGTTNVFFHITDSVDTKETVENGLIKNTHLLPGLYCVGGPTGMTGGMLEWIMKNMNWDYGNSDYINMIDNWNYLKAAESGLYIYPNLTGSRAPDWNPNARGTIVGLDPSHSFKEIFKGTVEGIAFNTKRIIQRTEALVGPINSIIAIGGGTKNKKMIETRVSITGVPFYLPQEREASTIGVFLLASINIEWFKNAEEAINNLNPIENIIDTTENEKEKYLQFYTEYEDRSDKIDELY